MKPINFQMFGIKTVYLNGFAVHTLKIRVKHNPFNLELIQKEARGLTVHFLTDRIELSFTTMDKNLFNLAAKTAGNITKQISQQNHNEKYQWLLSI
jgi:hypothetical protein